jgi:hypothetical protein
MQITDNSNDTEYGRRQDLSYGEQKELVSMTTITNTSITEDCLTR